MVTENRLFLAVVLIVLGGLTIVFSRDLSLSSALKMAEENNDELKLARAELDYADAQVSEAWSTALPLVTADVNYSRNLKETFFFINADEGFGGSNRISFTFKNEYSLTAKLEQTLLSYKVGKALQIAYKFDDFTNQNYDHQRRTILTKVKEAYYDALLSHEILKVTTESEQSALENYEETKTRYESGVTSEFDLLQAEVRWRNAIPKTLAAEKNYELAVNNLKTMLDIPLDEEIELSDAYESIPPMPDEPDLQSVFENRLDFRALQLERDLRDKNVSLEFANHLPTLSGTFTYTYSGRSDELKIENDYDNYVVGLRLNIPLFSGGYTNAQVQKARIDVRKSDTRLSQTEDQIRVQLKNVMLSLREARKEIESAQKSVDAATRAFDIAEARLENGLATQLEVKDSRVFLDQAKVSLLTARFNYLKAYFQWQLVSGQWQEIDTI